MKEHLEFDLMDKQAAVKAAKAFSSDVRLHILDALKSKPLNLSEIAQIVEIPISSTAMHINVLEEAGIVITRSLPGLRGSQKVCGLKTEKVTFDILSPETAETDSIAVINMPIGNYFDCEVSAPCGIVSAHSFLSSEDNASGFYSPEKHSAQLLWFTTGYLEYRFPNSRIKKARKLKSLEFSFEICSEAPGYNNNWKSDISVEINHQSPGFFTSEGDFGGRRGRLNPSWWDNNMTQFGTLKHITINKEGTYLDGSHFSFLSIDDYKFSSGDYISFKIGVNEDSKYVGGLNLFGESFGDYEQSIVMKIIY